MQLITPKHYNGNLVKIIWSIARCTTVCTLCMCVCMYVYMLLYVCTMYCGITSHTSYLQINFEVCPKCQASPLGMGHIEI